jgi:hypothetical protein
MGGGVKCRLDASFDNLYSRKGIREDTGDVNSAKAYATNGETFWRIFNGRVSLMYIVLREVNYEVILLKKDINTSDVVKCFRSVGI